MLFENTEVFNFEGTNNIVARVQYFVKEHNI